MEDMEWKRLIPVLNVKRLELLNICDSNGYLTQEEGLQIYQHKETVSIAVNELVKHGLLEEKPAPENTDKQKAYDITEKGKVFTE